MSVKTKWYNWRLLLEVEHNPAPLYQPSKAERTVRLFPVGSSYLSLSRPVRKALLMGCEEYDLSAAQLTLAAHIWKIPTLTAALTKHRLLGPWALLGQLAGLPIKGSFRPAFPQKVVLKRAVYALLFGASQKTVTKYLLEGTEGVPGLTSTQTEQFLTSELLQDILAAQKNRQKQIEAEGGITTVFGRWAPLSPGKTGRDPRSLMAEEMQAYELYLLRLIQLGAGQAIQAST